jgi:RimJ/RimL family protein N-acetyltransferase
MFSLKLQKTTMATESIYLVVKHCFEMLHCDQIYWRCNLKNTNSFNAALRFGFYHDGVQRYHGIDYESFNMIRPEWNEFIQDEYRRWLNASNFDEKGQQKSKLELRKQ